MALQRSVPSLVASMAVKRWVPMGFSAGDIISLGTVSGVAGFSDDPMSLYLKPGDEVECEIENVGILRNKIVASADVHTAA